MIKQEGDEAYDFKLYLVGQHYNGQLFTVDFLYKPDVGEEIHFHGRSNTGFIKAYLMAISGIIRIIKNNDTRRN